MDEPVVHTAQGKVQGRRSVDYKCREYYSFQGIPYAKPPVGNLRFKAPLPPESWKGVRDATKEGNLSLSTHMLTGLHAGSEDCLYLNVYTPQLWNYRLPVMVWIHGGAFTAGSGNEDLYGPQFLVHDNIVLVTINYRLGLLGFMNLEDTCLGVPGNAALKDMVMSLKWVKENIANFGGDPNNVTIFGESAGAGSVHLIVLSPAAQGLFHKAIIQSGCALNPWAINKGCALEAARYMGYTGSDAEEEILKFLMSAPEEKFLDAQKKIPDPIEADTLRPYGPVIEKPGGEFPFLTEKPINIILSGKYSKVPMMMGYTTREGMMMEVRHKMVCGEVQQIKDFQTTIPNNYNIPKNTELSKRVAKLIQDFYYKNETPSDDNIDHFYVIETDILFWRGLYSSIRAHVNTSTAPLYFYRMSVESDLNMYKKMYELTNPGVAHGDDIGYLFKTIITPEIEPNSPEAKGVYRFTKLWTNFAKYGNPNPMQPDPLIDVNWEPVRPGIMKCLDIGEELSFEINPDLDRMELWDNISELCAMNSKL